MHYVNDEGPVRTINNCPQNGASRVLSEDDPEIIEYLARVEKLLSGKKSAEEYIEEQLSSPMGRILIELLPDSEKRIRDVLRAQYEESRIGIDIQR